jgi:hypothetical protein
VRGRVRASVAAACSVAFAGAFALASCGGAPILPGVGGTIPSCSAVPQIAAAPQFYRDNPIYVANEMPTDAVMAWAQGKPGYEGIWIDREHNGWVSVAFSQDAAARQAEIATEFPGEGVVAVAVDWKMVELEALQQRVMRDGVPEVMGSGIRPNYGVVDIFAGVLKPETVAAVNAKFAGERVCIEGIDPADAPAEGPQPQAGDGWRLLADEDEVGGPYRTGLAADQTALEVLWEAIGLATAMPEVDFQREVVVWFGAVHGSSCPRLRLDGVVADAEQALLYAEITSFELGACTADAIGHAYVVAVERSKLPKGRFTIQLEGGERPAGVIAEELTIVDADLTVPGAKLSDGRLHSAAPPLEESRVEPGGFIEPDVEPQRYRLSVACGIEWLGELNGWDWRTNVPAGEASFVPPEWRSELEPGGTIDLALTLHVDPEPAIEALAGSHTVIYHPSAAAAPTCE